MTALMVPDLLEPNEEIKGLADHIVSSLVEVKAHLADFVALN
jgi:hypothetical protein